MDIVEHKVSVDGAFEFRLRDARGDTGNLARANEAAIAGDAGIEYPVCGLGPIVVDAPGFKRIEKVGEAVDCGQDLQQRNKASLGKHTQQRFTVFGLNLGRVDIERSIFAKIHVGILPSEDAHLRERLEANVSKGDKMLVMLRPA